MQMRGAGAGRQCTQKMRCMDVTRDVSQPEMSALKLCKCEKTKLMSVTPETHQPAMAPYFVVAAPTFESYSVAAVFRSALLVNVEVQAGGEGEDGGGEGEAGGGEGGIGGSMKRGPQSVQSVPYAQLLPVAPLPPSWQ